MSLSDIDRDLLQRCLRKGEHAWDDFVDRFLGLVVHVVNHTAETRSFRISPQDREDLAAEVMLAVVDNDYAVLRNFRGNSSLATYLTVIARRVVVREMLKRRTAPAQNSPASDPMDPRARHTPPAEERISNRDEVEQLLRALHGPEADVIRMYHLEGKSYQEISSSIGMPENSIGPTLRRARAKLRQANI